MMVIAFLLAAAVTADVPDLAAIDRAVAKCDTKVMSGIFSAEPQRRRALAIAAFEEQEQIIAARRALAAKRLAPTLVIAPAVGGVTPADNSAELDRQGRLIAERQQALDDARLLDGMRDQLLDMMRQQYVAKCSAVKSDDR